MALKEPGKVDIWPKRETAADIVTISLQLGLLIDFYSSVLISISCPGHHSTLFCFAHLQSVQLFLQGHTSCALHICVFLHTSSHFIPNTFRQFQQLIAGIPEHLQLLTIVTNSSCCCCTGTYFWFSLHTSNIFMFSLLSYCISSLYSV